MKKAKIRQFGQPKRLFAFKKSRHMQRWLLCNPWTKPVSALNVAAVRIQSLFRGYRIRKPRYGGNIPPLSSTSKSKYYLPPSQSFRMKQKQQLKRYLAYMDDCKSGVRNRPQWVDRGYSSLWVVRIQCWHRMLKPRDVFLKKRLLFAHYYFQ